MRARFTPVALACLGLVVMLGSLRASGYPVPSPVVERWEFDFQPGYLRLATLPTGANGEMEAYWYFTFTVTNNGSMDREYAPSFVMYDSEGELRASGAPPKATKAILELLDNPLIEDEISIGGTLRVGKANARSGVVIWPVESAAVDQVIIFVGNISGETAVETDPLTGEKVVLRKTLALTYDTPGDVLPLLRQGGLPEPSDSLWIMR